MAPWKKKYQSSHSLKMIGGGISLAATLSGLFQQKEEAIKHELYDRESNDFFTAEGDLPFYSMTEIRQHTSHDTGVWVTFEGFVYDVTSFMDSHPGGPNRILMVAGNDLKEYWNVYDLHKRKHVLELLSKYCIGRLKPSERVKIEEDSKFSDTYANEPKRPYVAENPDHFRIASVRPWNVEPKKELLTQSWYTPNEIFWVRNHNPVPTIDLDEYRLEIVGTGVKSDGIILTLDDIKSKFPKVEIDATIQCAGNRQEDYVQWSDEWQEARPLWLAPHWENGAIGNAKWGGVRVRDLLKYAGIDVDRMALDDYPGYENDYKWISFIGEDADETGVNYGGVLPFEKVLDPKGDCILAYEMNGVPLPRDHGAPLRVIAPGHAGCRQVKWVSAIEVGDKPSDLDSGSKLDRHFSPCICFDDIRFGEDGLDLSTAPVIQTLPVQSIICNHQIDYKKQCIKVNGVAWAGGGKGISRVDVSVDGGKNWFASRIKSEKECTYKRNWAWVHWDVCVPFSECLQRHMRTGTRPLDIEVCSKAVDTDFNAQPERMEPYWNVLGICVNHWMREKITIDPHR